jgi:hypothetical protein
MGILSFLRECELQLFFLFSYVLKVRKIDLLALLSNMLRLHSLS